MITADIILRRVAELYGTYGIKVCSMDDIAHACGISKKTLYSMFANKYELVETLVAALATWFSSACNEVRKTAPNAIHEAFQALAIVEPLYRSLHYRMFYDMEKHYHPIWRKMDSFKNETALELITRNISRGIKEGLFVDDYDIDILGKMRLNQLDNIHRQAEAGNLHAILHETTRHYLRGMATGKGLKEIDILSNTITDKQK